jgi:GalNAc-alpha-(1->4)-GalNAc-alpha-(1->3)-diNAcBac-PP-undecaprenol alpha-1,4-N-acetyl-D-galactosaminyltransferase
MRITFVISALNSGGAQRVMSTMANYWDAHGESVALITVTGKEHQPFYSLSPGVQWLPLGQARSSRTPIHAVLNNARRLLRLRQTIQRSKPDVVISFLDTTNVLTLLSTRATGLPVIVEEHTDPNLSRPHPIWKQLRTLLYPRATRLIVLSESSKQFFSERVQRKTLIIPNPLHVDPIADPTLKAARPQIVSMGRLSHEKGFDQLIDAFARIAGRFPDWDLVIWGEGPLRSTLSEQRDRLGLTDRVLLPGNTTKPHDELSKGQIYALPSRREGFPMALAEGMACGLPAVAFDLPSGPKIIMRDGIDGLLVPMGDVPAFACALERLMCNDAIRAEMASHAPDVRDRYGVDRVMAVWSDMVAEAIRRR